MGAMPLFPAVQAAQKSFTLLPLGASTPNPVITIFFSGHIN